MRYYFITGSSKGIGLALTRRLLENQDNYVVGISRSNDLQHPRFRYVSVDFSTINDVVDVTDKIFYVEGAPDSIVLVNNAGTLGEVGYIGEIDAQDIPFIYNVNLIAPAILMNEFIRHFGKRGKEVTILNISSGAGNYPVDGWGGYCATKAALNMLSQVVATEQEIRKTGVKIYAVAPGVVDTEMQGKIRNTSKQQFSGVEKFKNLKESDALASADLAASKIIHILENTSKFADVIQDVRNI